MSGTTTDLVIMSYNEIEGLTALLPKFKTAAFNRVFAVDGGSGDGSVGLLEKNKIPVIGQSKGGRGEAFVIAADQSKADYLLFFGPDGNEEPEDFPRFLEIIEKETPDIVIASRMMKGSWNEEDIKLFKWRKWANNAFNLAANILFRRQGPFITDSINGYRAVRRELIAELGLDQPGFAIEYQMTMRALGARKKIVEFPTREGERIGGESGAGSIATGLLFIKVLLSEFGRYLFKGKSKK